MAALRVPFEATFSLRWFLQGNCISVLYYLLISYPSSSSIFKVLSDHPFICLILFALLNFTYCWLYYRTWFTRQVAFQGCLLGVLSGIGLIIGLSSNTFHPFGWYLIILSFFHFSEFFSTCIYNYESLSLDSYLLNHSIAYHVAALASWLEFFAELYFFPGLKSLWYISVLGCVLCVAGEFMRKLAMLTAGRSFNHYIQTTKADDHELVTHGVYSWSRHPSYVGWFYWSLGTQLILCNPLCLVAYTVTSWRFFNERVEDEEITLVAFFGQRYVEYQQRVGTGLPFIKGYKL
ncbi:protein-S-isoprenylcysteine O-methyltransferase-like [Diadema antillarum]|uniref:protein-S-isoprenylcysteine O-methyltransferase-like n=1 Tax=Diadema antillarum TaxID=105358 RepID=UPI003A899DB0